MKRKAFAFHAVAGTLSVLWLLPIALVLLTAIRTFDDIAGNGLGAMPSSFSLDSFGAAWNAGGQSRAMLNSLLVTVPTVLLALALSAMAAFALSRYDIPYRRAVLLLILAGNLLPPQILPVSPALLGLQGQYVSNWNVIAAGPVIAAIPTVGVFLRFQKHFISGLAIGAVK